MSTGLIILIVIVVLIILMYNNLNSSKNRVEKSFSNIDVYLEARHEKIAGLLEDILMHMDHEKSLYKDISALRTGIANSRNGGINAKIQAENEISAFIARPSLTAEAYPQLESIKNIGVTLANERIKSEDDLAAARRQYNNNATSYNTSLTAFPTNIIAGMFGFNTPYELFKVEEHKKERPTYAAAASAHVAATEILNKKSENE